MRSCQAGGLRVLHHLHRVGLQLRRTGQPAHALCAHVVVDHAAAIELLVGQRRQHLVHTQLLVAPLVGVGIEKAGRVHLAWWADPVKCEGQRCPAGLRPQLFLAHVVCPAAAAFADTAAHHQHVDDAAVVHVAVVPVVHAGADDDHGAAFGLLGVVGELAGNRDDLVARHAGNLLLPGRGVWRVVVEVGCGQLTWQATRNTVLGRLQVENRGHHHLAGSLPFAERDALHRHGAYQYIALFVVWKMVVMDAAEIRKTDLGAVRARRVAFEH